jgi:hypothetical protein
MCVCARERERERERERQRERARAVSNFKIKFGGIRVTASVCSAIHSERLQGFQILESSSKINLNFRESERECACERVREREFD